MKNVWRAIAVTIGSFAAGCGGVGETGAVADNTPAAAAPHAWDSWNWDEGGFGD